MATPTVEDILGTDNILGYWLASDASAIGDGNAVENWTDRVNGHILTQGTASKRPIYRANYASTGQAALEFDGTDDFMLVTHASFDLTATGYCFIVAFKINVAGAFDRIIFLTDNTNWGSIRIENTTPKYTAQNKSQTTGQVSNGPNAINVFASWHHPNHMMLQSANESGGVELNTALFGGTNLYVASRDGTQQFLDGGLFAALLIDDAAGWYNVIEASVVLRNDLGQTLRDVLPVAAAGSAINRGIMTGGRM